MGSAASATKYHDDIKLTDIGQVATPKNNQQKERGQIFGLSDYKGIDQSDNSDVCVKRGKSLRSRSDGLRQVLSNPSRLSCTSSNARTSVVNGLQSIIKDTMACKRYIKFLEDEYNKLEEKDEPNIALNCLLFYIDVEDYSHLPESEFRTKRAYDIYGKYFTPYAIYPIPIEHLEKEELNNELDSHENSSSSVFDYFKEQAYSILEADSYIRFSEYFHKSNSNVSKTSNNANNNNYSSNSNSNESPPQNSSHLLYPLSPPKVLQPIRLAPIQQQQAQTQQSQSQAQAQKPYQKWDFDLTKCNTTKDKIELGKKMTMMDKIFSSSRKCYYFKSYLTNTGGKIEHLYFYLDVNDFYNMFCSLKDDSILNNKDTTTDVTTKEREKILCNEFFLTQASKIYDKYIRQGSLQQVTTDTELIQSIIDRLAKWNEKDCDYPYDVFMHASDLSLLFLMTNYLDDFLRSPEYKQYESESEVIHRKASHYDFKFLSSLPTKSVNTISEILSNQALCQMFETQLNDDYNKNLVNFYKEVQEYRCIPPIRKDYMMGRARKIYMKYIQRGSKQELDIDEECKRIVCSRIGLPSECKQTLFDPIINHVITQLEKTEYIHFLESTVYLEFLKSNNNVNPISQTDLKPECPIKFNEILNTSQYCVFFEKYLSSQFYDTCLHFWVDVEDFRRIPKSPYLNVRARKIYQRYLAKNAKQPVSVSDDALQIVETYLKKMQVSPCTFNISQNEIYNLMKDTLYPSFIESEQFKDLLKLYYENCEKLKKQKSFNESPPVDDNLSYVNSYYIDSIYQVLRDQRCSNHFRLFCNKINQTNLYFFWVECEEYKLIPDIGYMKVKAKKIVNKYITENSKMHVDLPPDISSKILESYKDNSSPALFLQAEKETEIVMERDLYPKFIESDEYKMFRQELESRKPSRPLSPEEM